MRRRARRGLRLRVIALGEGVVVAVPKVQRAAGVVDVVVEEVAVAVVVEKTGRA